MHVDGVQVKGTMQNMIHLVSFKVEAKLVLTAGGDIRTSRMHAFLLARMAVLLLLSLMPLK